MPAGIAHAPDQFNFLTAEYLLKGILRVRVKIDIHHMSMRNLNAAPGERHSITDRTRQRVRGLIGVGGRFHFLLFSCNNLLCFVIIYHNQQKPALPFQADRAVIYSPLGVISTRIASTTSPRRIADRTVFSFGVRLSTTRCGDGSSVRSNR